MNKVKRHSRHETIHLSFLEDFFSTGYSIPKCIAERGIQLEHTAMADTGKFEEETLERCVAYCLENHPEKNFVLISLYNAAIFGDQFNCICSNARGFANAEKAPGKCRIKCTGSNGYMQVSFSKNLQSSNFGVIGDSLSLIIHYY